MFNISKRQDNLKLKRANYFKDILAKSKKQFLEELSNSKVTET